MAKRGGIESYGIKKAPFSAEAPGKTFAPVNPESDFDRLARNRSWVTASVLKPLKLWHFDLGRRGQRSSIQGVAGSSPGQREGRDALLYEILHLLPDLSRGVIP